MSDRRPLVFIGVCAGDRDLIRAWAMAGELPTFRRLLETSLQCETHGLSGLYVGSNWPTIQTGCAPGRNRVHSWEQIRPGSYETYRVLAGRDMRMPPFWDHLSEAGLRACVLDVPHSGISERLNGLQTVEWGAHDGAFGFLASTPELERDIVTRFGRHPVSGNSDAARSHAELLEFRDELVYGARRKTELSVHFLRQERWDFFAQVFTEAHCAGHLLWHLHDPDYRWVHGGEREPGESDPVLDVYRAIDAGIGEILDAAGEDANVVVFPSLGMGPKYGAQFMADKILVGIRGATAYATPARPPRLRDRLDPMLTRAWQATPRFVRGWLDPLRTRTRDWVLEDRAPPPLIDPAASKSFLVQNNTAHAGIRINLIGREPGGKVAPGRDYEELLAELTCDLKSLVNLDTGRPIVDEVYRTDDLYSGPERDHIPDLLVDWSNDAPIRSVGSNRFGPIEGEYRYVRSGEHKPGGLLMLTGPGVTRGGRLADTQSVVHVGPTLTAMLGVSMGDVDGRPIAELVQSA